MLACLLLLPTRPHLAVEITSPPSISASDEGNKLFATEAFQREGYEAFPRLCGRRPRHPRCPEPRYPRSPDWYVSENLDYYHVVTELSFAEVYMPTNSGGHELPALNRPHG